MENQNMNQMSHPEYDPRWFIWTIVFLLVTGIALVSYIMLSDTSLADASSMVPVHHKAPTSTKK